MTRTAISPRLATRTRRSQPGRHLHPDQGAARGRDADAFEFQLRDASPLIGGEGTVVWTRENDPSRPAIAPGMGVRFDRLAEGSQGVLERILAEKAKQAPRAAASRVTKPPLFTDTPTRVAPAPIQDALLGDNDAAATRPASPTASHEQHTPLPKPMPFHSDAEDFDEQAFEEATKVRALDELVAQTAEGQARPPRCRRSPRRRARRHNGRPAAEPAARPAVSRRRRPRPGCRARRSRGRSRQPRRARKGCGTRAPPAHRGASPPPATASAGEDEARGRARGAPDAIAVRPPLGSRPRSVDRWADEPDRLGPGARGCRRATAPVRRTCRAGAAPARRWPS
jgi:hypothetical protein